MTWTAMDMKPLIPVLAACILAGCCCGKLEYADLQWASDAFDSGVWTKDSDGVLTASKDAAIWSAADYENFALDFEYKIGQGADAVVSLYCPDAVGGAANSVAIPLNRNARPAGEWNRMTVFARGKSVQVVVNGEKIQPADQPWLRGLSSGWQPTKGRIGFGCKNGKSHTYFRSMRIRRLQQP